MWFGKKGLTPEKVAAVLNEEFEARKKKNPNYSLRAFAQFLETDHSGLSKILRGERKISWETFKKIRGKIGL